MSIKEDLIRKYMMNVNFNGEWNIKDIGQEMHRFLGETPAIDVKWKKDVMLNEVEGTAKEIQAVERVSVVFTDEDDRGFPLFKKVEFIVNG